MGPFDENPAPVGRRPNQSLVSRRDLPTQSRRRRCTPRVATKTTTGRQGRYACGQFGDGGDDHVGRREGKGFGTGRRETPIVNARRGGTLSRARDLKKDPNGRHSTKAFQTTDSCQTPRVRRATGFNRLDAKGSSRRDRLRRRPPASRPPRFVRGRRGTRKDPPARSFSLSPHLEFEELSESSSSSTSSGTRFRPSREDPRRRSKAPRRFFQRREDERTEQESCGSFSPTGRDARESGGRGRSKTI